MKALSRVGLALLAVFVTALLVSGVFSTAAGMAPLASPVVKITLASGGHGSAVYLGNGLFLTANHVVNTPADQLTIVSQGANSCNANATILWTAPAYDIAVVSADCAGIKVAPLRCAALSVGERIVSYGSPMSFNFLRTWGRIAGDARKVGPWASAYPADISMGPGMSGGPVMDARGRVVGINVGVALAPLGMGASIFGLSMIVPATAVCRMMGRT